MTRVYDAVVFDFGGVLITSIGDKLVALAARHEVEPALMQDVLLGPRTASTDHPWHRVERGELPAAELQALLEPIAADSGIDLEGDESSVLFEATWVLHEHLIERVAALRAAGIRTALLTNSVKEFRPVLEAEVDLALFDVVVDSSEVGMRKPDAAIYALVTDRLGAAPERILYLDDFEHNLGPAEALGWGVVHVHSAGAAVEALDRLLSQATTGGDPPEGATR